jgi:hypothetical protein
MSVWSVAHMPANWAALHVLSMTTDIEVDSPTNCASAPTLRHDWVEDLLEKTD